MEINSRFDNNYLEVAILDDDLKNRNKFINHREYAIRNNVYKRTTITTNDFYIKS